LKRLCITQASEIHINARLFYVRQLSYASSVNQRNFKLILQHRYNTRKLLISNYFTPLNCHRNFGPQAVA